MEIAREAYPDITCIDPNAKYYDPKANDASKWVCVDCKLVEIFKRPIYLDEMKSLIELNDMETFRRSRLSITSVNQKEFDFICNLGRNTERPSSLSETTKKSTKKRKVEVNNDDNDDDNDVQHETKKSEKKGKK